MLGVRLDEKLDQRLEALAERTHRSKSHHAKEALKRYIEQEEYKEQARLETLTRWQAYSENGKHIANHAVMDWLDTWGSEPESSPPAK
jgi:predicted transcriptional regulator